jgi:hypothetical protein
MIEVRPIVRKKNTYFLAKIAKIKVDREMALIKPDGLILSHSKDLPKLL